MNAGAKGGRNSAIVLDDSDEEGASKVERQPSPISAPASSSSMHVLGDRAQMERERLERQKKRRRDAGLLDEESDPMTTEKPSKVGRQHVEGNHGQSSVDGKGKQSVPLYWNGTIKKSYNVYSPTAPGTRFEDFIRPTTPFRANGLSHVIMATYCEDIQWLAQMFPKGDGAPEITMITLASGDLKAGVYAPLHPQLPNWIRLVVPRRGLNEYTTMHMKFIMLYYEDRLRLMILSGNLVDYDWSRIENTAFIHDFHKLPSGEKDSSSAYGSQMRRVLSSLSVPAGHFAMRMMETYQMESYCEAQIVASLPTFTPVAGWNAIEELGVGRLAKVVRDMLGSSDKMIIETQGSSMGSYSPRWLQQIHLACSGADYKRFLPLPPGAKASKAWASATGCRESEKWPPIRLLFPSDKWVKTQSIEGTDGALTFFGKSKIAVEKGFIELLHQPVSVRGNIMMHHKAILAIRQAAEQNAYTDSRDSNVVGWAYMGSHNLTQAAWGNISSPKQGSEPQMSINNWELGIVVPLRAKDMAQFNKPEPDSMAANIVTWRRPVHRYANGDIPWDQFNQ